MRTSVSREAPVLRAPRRRDFSVADLAILENIDDLLRSFKESKGEKSRSDILAHIQSYNWTKSILTIMNGLNRSSSDVRFLCNVFHGIVDFIISDSCAPSLDTLTLTITASSSELCAFLSNLPDNEVMFSGASLWLTYAKLVVNTTGTKIPSTDWNNLFSPMKKWLKSFGGESLMFCLRAWCSFINLITPKSITAILERKLFNSLLHPMRSETVIKKLVDPSPIIKTYMSLLSVFSTRINDFFEKLIICFLQFLVGSPVCVIRDFRSVKDEVTKPVYATSFNLVLQGNPIEFSYFLTHERFYHPFEDALVHVIPVVSGILGVTSEQGVPECEFSPELIRKYSVFLCQTLRIACSGTNERSCADSVCLCFAALARRIEAVEDVGIRHQELQLLFLQVKTWVDESSCSAKELECALCHLLLPRDLTLHANTVGEYPAKDILSALLGKPSAKVSDFLELIPGTICSGLETNGIVLKRIGELCYLIEANLERFTVRALLSTWDSIATMLRRYIKEIDDINEGSFLKPDFSTTFNFLRLLFRAANFADEEVDIDLIKKCSSTFNGLYLEVQGTVRHEIDNNAETVLHGVCGNAVFLETLCCVNLYIRTLSSVATIYPFSSIQEEEMCSGSSIEFNALGEVATFVKLIQIVSNKLKSMAHSVKNEKPSRFLFVSYLSILKLCQQLFDTIEKPNLIRSMFLTLSEVLSQIHANILDSKLPGKDIREEAAAVFTSILESVQDKISGPYDSGLLSGCEELLVRLLGRGGYLYAMISVTACKLWMKTFAEAKSLNYSTRMKNVLLPLINRRVIHAPGLSNQTYSNGKIDNYTDDAISAASYSESRTPNSYVTNWCNVTEEGKRTSKMCGTFEYSVLSSLRTRKKRSCSDNQCSENLDSAGTATTGRVRGSPVLIESTFIKDGRIGEVTPRRKSTPHRKRLNMDSLDDDSVEYIPITSTESAKKMKLTERQREMFSEKRERMPFLDDDSQQSAVIAHLPEQFDTESSQAVSTNTTESRGTNTAENKKSDSCVMVENGVTGSFQCNPVHMKEEFTAVQTDCKSLRRIPNVKLNFDQKTPSKYGARRTSASKHIENMQEATIEVQSKSEPSTSVPASEELEKWELLNEDGHAVSHNSVLVLREIEDVLNVREPLNTSIEESDTNDIDRDISRTPEKESSAAKKMEDVLEPTIVERIIGTPGILKTVKTPSTSERKPRRVHFDEAMENRCSAVKPVVNVEVGEIGVAEEQFPASSEATSKQSTPRKPFSHLQPAIAEESVEMLATVHDAVPLVRSEVEFTSSVDINGPIFPLLADCEESIGRIVGRLLSISTATGALAARKSLEARGIVQIRHLAALTRHEVSLLNIRKPRIETAIRALSHFARTYTKSDPTSVVDKKSLFDEKEAPLVPLDAVETGLPENVINTISTNSTSVSENSTVDAEKKMDETTKNLDDHVQQEDEPAVTQSNRALVIEKIRRFKAVQEIIEKETVEAESVDAIQLLRTVRSSMRGLLDIVDWWEQVIST